MDLTHFRGLKVFLAVFGQRLAWGNRYYGCKIQPHILRSLISIYTESKNCSYMAMKELACESMKQYSYR